jgi:hypothetical protein
MSLQKIIPSYLYSQYQDDDNLQGFVDAYNTLAQQYVNTFLTIGLPLYPNFTGALLDWIGQGLYGYARPVLPSGHGNTTGPFNTWAFNSVVLNSRKVKGPANYYVTNDDVYIRCINWNFFRGDGTQFTVEWLKRRVARFLFGPGQPVAVPPAPAPPFTTWDYDVGQNYRISVSFGTDNEVTIRIINGLRTIVRGAIFNRFAFNTTAFNYLKSSFAPYSQPALAPVLKAAVQAGVLQLPFQFTFEVTY